MTPDAMPPVLILYNRPRRHEDGSAWHESGAGVLDEAAAVESAALRLGIETATAAVSHLGEVSRELAAAGPRVIFNLVETLGQDLHHASFVPALCEAAGRACTGVDTACLELTLNKWLCRAMLEAQGVRVPRACLAPLGQQAVEAGRLPRGKVIVKPLLADASEGIDAGSVVDAGDPRLYDVVRNVHVRFGQPALIEQYIGGRELNVSVLQVGDVVRVLPLAEIDFSAFPEGKPRIVDYAAKWLADSFAYHHTPRIIPADLPPAVAEEVCRLTRAAWQATGCRDYARVDVRLDAGLRPYVLEVNANPDIAPDAGFAAALAAGGLVYEDFVKTVLRNAAGRMRGGTASAGAGRSPAGEPAESEIRWSRPEDRASILRLLETTGFFAAHELDVAREVLDAALAGGAAGDYQSYTRVEGGRAAGWVCFGATPCTEGTYDIYWLATASERQRQGIGAALLRFAEEKIAEAGGRLCVVDTAGRPQYAPTRGFYERNGYTVSARIPDFYSPGDDKVVYVKRLRG